MTASENNGLRIVEMYDDTFENKGGYYVKALEALQRLYISAIYDNILTAQKRSDILNIFELPALNHYPTSYRKSVS